MRPTVPTWRPATRAGQIVGVAAQERDPVANRLAAPAHDPELRRGQLGGRRVAPPESALLVLPDDDLERMPRDDVVLGERLRDLDGAHRADVAVVVAAVRHAVNIRTEEDGLERG